MIDAHGALRDATKKTHEELHEHPAFRAMFNRSISVACYTELMVQFYRFYDGLDTRIRQAELAENNDSHSFDYHPRAPLFAADLASMRVNVFSQEAGSANWKLPSIRSVGALAGVLYVVEGSALGGAMMNKAIGRLPYEKGVLGRSYWEWCARVGKQRWTAALGFVSSTASDDSVVQEMVESAEETFQAMAIWLEPVRMSHTGAEPVLVPG